MSLRFELSRALDFQPEPAFEEAMDWLLLITATCTDACQNSNEPKLDLSTEEWEFHKVYRVAPALEAQRRHRVSRIISTGYPLTRRAGTRSSFF